MVGQEACRANPGIWKKRKKENWRPGVVLWPPHIHCDIHKPECSCMTPPHIYTYMCNCMYTHTHKQQTYIQYSTFNIGKLKRNYIISPFLPPLLLALLALFQIHALWPLFQKLYTHSFITYGIKSKTFTLTIKTFSNANSNIPCLLLICSLQFCPLKCRFALGDL